MKIGMIGAGHIGATLAGLLARVGHEVALSNSRGPDTLENLVADLNKNAQNNSEGGSVRAMTAEDAASFGDLVIEAIPFGHYRDLPKEQLKGKTLVSASNYYTNRDGEIDFDGHTQTGLVASYLSATTVVKAFNTIYWEHLHRQGDTTKSLEERRVIFLAGDDETAKKEVADLIEELGFGPFDAGSLSESAVQEPGADVYTEDMTLAEAKEKFAQKS